MGLERDGSPSCSKMLLVVASPVLERRKEDDISGVLESRGVASVRKETQVNTRMLRVTGTLYTITEMHEG